MRKARFSLRGLLVLMTAIVLFMGWLQYRRRTILANCEELKSSGYVFRVPDKWHDWVFQRKPIVGTIHVVDGDEFLQTVKVMRLKNNSVVKYDTFVWGEDLEKIKGMGVVVYK